MEEYFKGVSAIKLTLIIGLILSFMVGFARIANAWVIINAEYNKTISNPRTERGFPKILDDDKWSSQLVYDTLGACYQGTIKWIIMTNPSLLGQTPGPGAQRQMIEHCFCVMDKVRKNQPLEEYAKKIFDQVYIGDLFMRKAIECIGEYKTLPSFFNMKLPTSDNETKSDNSTSTLKKEEPKIDSEESLPDQPRIRESLGDSDTTFQG